MGNFTFYYQTLKNSLINIWPLTYILFQNFNLTDKKLQMLFHQCFVSYKVVIMKSNMHHCLIAQLRHPSRPAALFFFSAICLRSSFTWSKYFMLSFSGPDMFSFTCLRASLLYICLGMVESVSFYECDYIQICSYFIPVINCSLPCFAGELRAHQVLELQLSEDLLQTVLVQLVQVLWSSLRHLWL